ncbi:Uncharacterized protein PRO82_000335 [Candidatus Protochlamydia amoebophila]|nr:Uncharacterized protein [Candidatus Protochlamydia amoebophila]
MNFFIRKLVRTKLFNIIVTKSLSLMQINLCHPSLNSHKFDAISSPLVKGSRLFKIKHLKHITSFGAMALSINYIIAITLHP